MSTPTLTKIQTALLIAAATNSDGFVTMPERMSDAVAARHLATFEDLKPIVSREAGDDTTPHLTLARYHAVEAPTAVQAEGAGRRLGRGLARARDRGGHELRSAPRRIEPL